MVGMTVGLLGKDLTEVQRERIVSILTELMKQYGKVTCHHDGSEELEEICEELKLDAEIHKGISHYKEIVEASRKVIGAVGGFRVKTQSTTWRMLHEAFSRGIPSIVIWPDGTCSSRGFR